MPRATEIDPAEIDPTEIDPTEIGPVGSASPAATDDATAASVSPASSAPSASTATPDPFDDADALGDLEHEIATLAAHIQAATHRLLVMIAEFDRRRGWQLGGHRTCAHWLHHVTGIDLGAAREKVRTARALEELPRTSELMSRGELSFSAVRALTRVATPECEEELLEVAKSATTAELERFVRGWRRMSRADEAELERARWRSRRWSVFPDQEGMYVVKGKVPAEVGAVLMRAVEAAADALYRAEGQDEVTPKQRRADAIGLVAERALAAGFGSEVEEVPLSGTRPERYQVMLHVDPSTLRGDPDAEPGLSSHLEDGTRVSAETSRRLCCDAAVVEVTGDGNGSVLDVGRRTRTIPPALRRALEVRDRGCRFPGCGLRFNEGHHVVHWEDGGETSLKNTVLLCRYHHWLVHEGGWTMAWSTEGAAIFFDPKGGAHADAWPPARRRAAGLEPTEHPAQAPAENSAEHPVETLIEENRARGVEPDGWSLLPRPHLPPPASLRPESLRPGSGIPWALQAPALEALDAAHFGV